MLNHPIRIAGIDIGTNTILMVIGEKYQTGELKFIRNEHSIARLGEGVDKTHLIKPEAIERAKIILTEYKNICDKNNVKYVSASGTSALRDAQNREEVINELSSFIGTEIKVITGEEEARLSYLGTIEDDKLYTVVDIGGGSTEFITGENKIIKTRHSISIGAVRLTERYFKQQPAGISDFQKAETYIIESLNKIKKEDYNGELIGVAGTPTTLAAVAQGITKFEKGKVHNFILNYETINNIFNNLKVLTIEGIKGINGIHPDRADIITAGTLILKSIMNFYGIDVIRVSTRGLRYGILIELAKNY